MLGWLRADSMPALSHSIGSLQFSMADMIPLPQGPALRSQGRVNPFQTSDIQQLDPWECAVGSVFFIFSPFHFSFDPSLVCHSLTALLFLFLFLHFLLFCQDATQGSQCSIAGEQLASAGWLWLWLGVCGFNPQSEIFAAADLNNPALPSSLQH